MRIVFFKTKNMFPLLEVKIRSTFGTRNDVILLDCISEAFVILNK